MKTNPIVKSNFNDMVQELTQKVYNHIIDNNEVEIWYRYLTDAGDREITKEEIDNFCKEIQHYRDEKSKSK